MDADDGPLTPQEAKVLHALARVVTALPKTLDSELVRASGLTMTERRVMSILSSAPDQRLRMSDLAATCAFSLSGVTRIVQRLAGAGWVERQRTADDARSWHAHLTEEGDERLRSSERAYTTCVRRQIIEPLHGEDLEALTRALTRLDPSEHRSPAPQA